MKHGELFLPVQSQPFNRLKRLTNLKGDAAIPNYFEHLAQPKYYL